MKAIIIGAGVAGLTTAVSLLETGHEVEVFERGPELRAGGNGVLLWPNGTSILRDLGIGVDDLGARMDNADIMSYDEKPLMRVDLSDIATRLGSHVAGVMRGEIVRRLAAVLPEGVLRTGKRCVAIETGGDAPVTAVFEDGTRAEGDVLIGADGYRSVVRRHLFGPADIAEYTGLATWHGTTLKQIGGLDTHFVPAYYGRKVAFTTHSVGDGMKHWAFEVGWPIPGLDATGVVGDQTSPAGPPGTGPSRLDLLRTWFKGFPPAVEDLLDVLTEEDIKVHPHVIHRVRKWWGEGPITLVGDAAHAVPPRVGWGVNQALEDGWVLGRALDGATDPTPRLRLYEKTRRGRARRVRSRGAMLKHVNRMVLLLRAKPRGIEATRLVQGNIMNCSNYLHGEAPKPITLSA